MTNLYRILCYEDGTYWPQYSEPLRGLDGRIKYLQWCDFLTYFDTLEEAKKALKRKVGKQPPRLGQENANIIDISLDELN